MGVAILIVAQFEGKVKGKFSVFGSQKMLENQSVAKFFIDPFHCWVYPLCIPLNLHLHRSLYSILPYIVCPLYSYSIISLV